MKYSTEDINAYLIALRDTGMTNMWAAVPYLEEAFDMSRAEAKIALFAWMKFFKQETK